MLIVCWLVDPTACYKIHPTSDNMDGCPQFEWSSDIQNALIASYSDAQDCTDGTGTWSTTSASG